MIQRNLSVSSPGDPLELEADRTADQVMRMTTAGERPQISRMTAGAPIHRSCAACAAAENNPSAAVAQVIAGGGGSLDEGTRAFMEARFGQDFGGVRVHTGTDAAASARSLNARAYTVGRDIVFDSGQYQPNTASGRRLLAHELTHSVQQGGAVAAQRYLAVQRQSGDDGDTYADDATPADARAALIDSVGADKVEYYEALAMGSGTDGGNGGAMVSRAAANGSPAQHLNIGIADGEMVARSPAGVAIAAGVILAFALCAFAWFEYTLDHYSSSKSDKWMHCYASCKIATWCPPIPGVSHAYALGVGITKELVDAFLPGHQSEWEDFVADVEGLAGCAIAHPFTTCYDCCNTKRS